MDGFLSERIRDVISLVGVVLALLGTVFSIFRLDLRLSGANANQSKSPATGSSLLHTAWRFIKSPPEEAKDASKIVRNALLFSIGIFLFSAISVLVGVYIDWNGLVGVAGTLAMFQFIALAVALIGIDTWLRNIQVRRASLKRWSFSLYGGWLSAMLLSVLVLTYTKLPVNLIGRWSLALLFMQTLGLFAASGLFMLMFVLGGIAHFSKRF